MPITNDREFKEALNGFTPARQRQLAARFTLGVLDLCSDPRVRGAVEAAQRVEMSGAELVAAFQGAKAARVESFTRCGKEADWLAQAGHFVAEAALACVRPDGRGNPAWDAAMNARMARSAATIANGEGDNHREADEQYRLVEMFLNV